MLAQNFKSAADLGIPEKHHDALIKTLVLMETGKIKHVPLYETAYRLLKRSDGTELLFNMGQWETGHQCGTVCCIGGTAERVGNVKFYTTEFEMPEALDGLFYMDKLDVNMDLPTVEQGAQALRNYLTYGEARWEEIMEKNNG